jgi:hypothetical protein
MKTLSRHEALLEIERQLLERTERPIVNWRFFPYPAPGGRLVLACAELPDGTDVTQLFETDVPVADPDNFDEDAMAEIFLAVPSSSVH